VDDRRIDPPILTTRNEFGTQRLRPRIAHLLCVPSEKDGVPSALELDHFKCYAEVDGLGAPLREREVTLSDQFRTARTRVRRPVSFCPPVDKNGEDIRNPQDALQCYFIVDRAEGPLNRAVRVSNQFGEQELLVQHPTNLCLPTERLALPPGD
jgi:hypothetical protein